MFSSFIEFINELINDEYLQFVFCQYLMCDNIFSCGDFVYGADYKDSEVPKKCNL